MKGSALVVFIILFSLTLGLFFILQNNFGRKQPFLIKEESEKKIVIEPEKKIDIKIINQAKDYKVEFEDDKAKESVKKALLLLAEKRQAIDNNFKVNVFIPIENSRRFDVVEKTVNLDKPVEFVFVNSLSRSLGKVATVRFFIYVNDGGQLTVKLVIDKSLQRQDSFAATLAVAEALEFLDWGKADYPREQASWPYYQFLTEGIKHGEMPPLIIVPEK